MDQEYNFPSEPLAAVEFHPPGQEFPQPSESYGPRSEEYPKPGSPDGISLRPRNRSAILLSAILIVATLSTAAQLPEKPILPQPPAVTEAVAETTPVPPAETEIVIESQPMEQTEPTAVPTEQTLPEPEPFVILGTWTSEDYEELVTFDEEGGWWNFAKSELYGLMRWDTDADGTVQYSCSAVNIELDESDGSSIPRMVYRTVESTVTVLSPDPEPRIQMVSPITGKETVYIPYEYLDVSSAHYFYTADIRREIPDTSWEVAPFDTISHAVSLAEEYAEITGVPSVGHVVWISDLQINGDICDFTLSDNLDGSRSYSCLWHWEDTILILDLPEPIEYAIYDPADGSTETYLYEGSELRVPVVFWDNGAVLCVPNPFFRAPYAVDHEMMIRYR